MYKDRNIERRSGNKDPAPIRKNVKLAGKFYSFEKKENQSRKQS